MGILSTIFGADKAIESVENIATEWIQTDKERAEAKALFVKTLDPNGKMRRDISKFTAKAYGFYLVATTILIAMQAFGIGDAEGAEKAAIMMTENFVPITTAWGAIVTASFGVNTMNSYKGN